MQLAVNRPLCFAVVMGPPQNHPLGDSLPPYSIVLSDAGWKELFLEAWGI